MTRRCASSQYHASLTFQDAAHAFTQAWRRKHHSEPVPALSHALSTSGVDGTWSLASAETGSQLCNVDPDGVTSWPEDWVDQ